MKTHLLFKTIVFTFLFLFFKIISIAQTCGSIGQNLPSSGTPTSPFFDLNATLVLTGNLTLNTIDVLISPGVNIIVPSGITLTLHETYLHPCDIEMWGGIIVEAGGILIINHNSLIESAEFGVRANENSTPSNQSKINISDSYFFSNYTGILIDPNTSGNFNNIAFHVTNTRFDGSAGLINHSNISYPGILPYVGIEINDMNCIIGQTGTLPNYFTELNNGILSHKSILTVKTSSFRRIVDATLFFFMPWIISGRAISGDGNSAAYHLNVHGDIYSYINYCGYGIYSDGVAVNLFYNTIENVYGGIFLINLPTATSSSVNFNTILNSEKWGIASAYHDKIDILEIYQNTIIQDAIALGQGSGIGLYDYLKPRHINVFDNDITILNGNYGIEMVATQNNNVIQNSIDLINNTSTIDYFGMSLDGCMENTISCNDLIGSSNSASNDFQQFGYYASQSPFNLIQCNTASSISHAFEIRGNCSMTELFKGNVMNSSYVGLNLSFSAAMNSPETSTQTDEGNIWNGPFSGPNDAVNTGTPSASEFYTNPGIPSLTPINPLPNLGWFFPSSSSFYFQCQTDIVCLDRLGGGGDNRNSSGGNFDSLIANNGYYPQEFTDESIALANRYLFDKIKQNDSMLNEQLYSNFFNSFQDSSLSNFSLVSDSINSIYEVSSSQWNSISVSDSIYNKYQLDLDLVDSLFSANVIDSTTYLYSLDSISNLITNVSESIKQISETINLQIELKVDDLIILNNNLICSNILEENEKIVQDIYLKSVAKNIFKLDSIQILKLQSIIHQCPFTGGPSVYKARALYNLVNSSEVYSDKQVCNQLGIYRKSRQFISSKLYSFIYPNPANEHFTLSYKIPESSKAELQIFNSSLILVHSETLSEYNTLKKINVESLKSDLYFYNIIQQNQVISSGKINVIR